MRAFAFWTAAATIVVLNAVLCLDLLGEGETVLLGHMLIVLHVVMPISSLVMLVLMAKDRHWPGVVLFVIASPLAIVPFFVPPLSPGIHAVIDLAGLNVYLIVVPRFWPRRQNPVLHRAGRAD